MQDFCWPHQMIVGDRKETRNLYLVMICSRQNRFFRKRLIFIEYLLCDDI